MASEKVLSHKKEVVAELKQRIDGSCAGVLVDYLGISVEKDTELRASLRKAGVQYTVAKNTLLEIAVRDGKLQDLTKYLAGPTAIATHETDFTAAAKILTEFAKKNEVFTIKCGYADGAVLDVKQVGELAKLPSKEELVAKTLYCLNAPITGFASVLNATIRSLAIALNEVAKQKQA